MNTSLKINMKLNRVWNSKLKFWKKKSKQEFNFKEKVNAIKLFSFIKLPPKCYDDLWKKRRKIKEREERTKRYYKDNDKIKFCVAKALWV